MLVVLALVAGIGPRTCERWIDGHLADRTREIQRRLLPLLAPLPPADRDPVVAGLAVAVARAESERLAPFAYSTLAHRSNAVIADGRITAAEARHLLALLTDIADWEDRVHVPRYLGAR